MTSDNKRTIFGTDGVRGRANVYPMTADMALRLGQAAASVIAKYQEENSTDSNNASGVRKKLKAVIGKDTRISGYLFEYALTAGLCSMGVDVYLVGPMPTPAVAHLTKSFAADFGIVISASHNPACDNGIKFFDSNGFKLPDAIEADIETMVFSDFSTPRCSEVGKAFRIDDAAGRYIEYMKNSIKNMSLEGLKIVLDCANGAAYKVAPLIFSELGAQTIVLNNHPDGKNINLGCGSQNPACIRKAVLDSNADIGVALDGDADRVIMVDEKGDEVDGDHIIAMCALDMKRRNKLKENSVVVTVMTNIGFDIAMKNAGIKVIRSKVGDRYVVEAMRDGGYSLGGEQSGHIIFFNRSTTGDGILSALQVLALMKKSYISLSELAGCMTSFPQVLMNVTVKEKIPLELLPEVSTVVSDVKEKLGSEGRVLVRYSGTENKCRVMVEGLDEDEIALFANSIVEAFVNEAGEDK